MFAHQVQHRGPEGLATLAIARPAAFARRQTGRAIRRKCPACRTSPISSIARQWVPFRRKGMSCRPVSVS
jgi:hypothetical protein